ncbi:hypothetical protein AB4K20DRAFT_1996359 [Rhizopus microsporus]|uniref:Uncharacterized protein n=1 Tax=Rhizopus microsporus TaxID=58291 RepID=A0A1X0SFV2_RHIZD|nr:hypothetical protein BCV71DRAFT_281089 [Rhizopus microsporus]
MYDACLEPRPKHVRNLTINATACTLRDFSHLSSKRHTKHLKFFTLLTYATIIIAMFSADTQSRNSRLYQDFIKALRSSIIFSLQNIDTVFLLLLFNIPNPGSPSSSLNKAQLTAKIYWILVMAAPKEKLQGQRVTKVITIHPHTNSPLCYVAVFEEYKHRIASSDCHTAHPLFPKTYQLFSATSINFSVSILDQQPRSRYTTCNVM